MRNFIKYTLSIIIVLLVFNNFNPIKTYSMEFFINLLVFLILLVIFIKKHLLINKKVLSGGLTISVFMFFFFFVGTLNYTIIYFLYPKSNFIGDIETTQKFYISVFFLFSLGYFILNKNKISKIPQRAILVSNTRLLIFGMSGLGLLGTLIGIINIGYIPILVKGAGAATRYFDQMGKLSILLWQVNLLNALFCLQAFRNKRKKLYLILYFFSIVQLAFFVVRIFLFLALIGSIMIYIFIEGKQNGIKKEIFIKTGAFLILLVLMNTFYLQQREGSRYWAERKRPKGLSSFQLNYLVISFNEFSQLNYLIRSYDEPLYGKTFLSIPLSFLPNKVWKIFQIDKNEIKNINSATILQNIHGSVMGLRTGLAGELYVNFSFWGAFFALFFGMLIGKFDRYMFSLNEKDHRLPIIVLFIVIHLYFIVNGQVDSYSTMLYNYFLIIVLIALFVPIKLINFIPSRSK